jgi:predicted short-subunit dehydrogenase-like oxidoreductase (DUF2520 family)
MISVVIIGSGNVAQHLIRIFNQSNSVNIVQVFSRKDMNMDFLIDSSKVTNQYRDLVAADLYIIAVSDNAIAEVSNQLPFKNRLVVHTSGSMSIDVLNNNNRKGVFYPLQTFSKNKNIDLKQTPICLEVQHNSDYNVLETVAQSISEKVVPINSTQRKALHVSAVFACNFVNHLYKITNDICNDNNVAFDMIKPLIMETAQKIMTLSPTAAQTGPAKRQNTAVINSHLTFLLDENQKEIYKILTKSIIDNG